MVIQLCREAQKRWKKLKGAEWMQLVAAGQEFADGKLVEEAETIKNVA